MSQIKNKNDSTMKKWTFGLLATTFAIAAFAGNGPTDPTVLKIDAQKSKVFWTGKKVTGEHTGTVMLRSGTVEVLDGVPVKVNALIDMTTIVVEDIKDPGTNAKLLGHLKSDDFFSVEKYDTGIFEASTFVPKANAEGRDPNYKVKGKLTLKGIAKPVEFEAFISTNGTMLMSNCDLKINRTHWDIKYGSGSFFDNLGDRAIYDDIELVLVISAAQ